MPMNWTIAPAKTKKCQIKWATLDFFLANGIMPNEYTTPPAKMNINNGMLFWARNGINTNADQPRIKYKGRCSHLSLPGPNIETKVIPVIMTAHWTAQRIVPNGWDV